jgi:hypothetical protein
MRSPHPPHAGIADSGRSRQAASRPVSRLARLLLGSSWRRCGAPSAASAPSRGPHEARRSPARDTALQQARPPANCGPRHDAKGRGDLNVLPALCGQQNNPRSQHQARRGPAPAPPTAQSAPPSKMPLPQYASTVSSILKNTAAL